MSRTHLITVLSTSMVALVCACAASMQASADANASATSEAQAADGEPAVASEAEPEPTAASDAPSTDAAAEPTAPADPAASGASDVPPETRTLTRVAKIIKDNRQPVRDCYVQAQKKQPDLKGTLTIHFLLDAEGAVKSAEVNAERTDMQSPEVADCAIKLIRSLKYPPSSRGMESEINYPFDFKP